MKATKSGEYQPTDRETEFLKHLRENYYLIPREYRKGIAGGALTILLLTGVVSWSAAKGAVETGAAATATAAIIGYRATAQQATEDITARQRALTSGPILALPVGTVISSFLPPTKFGQAVDDPFQFHPEVSKWAVADGLLNVGGSDYFDLTGNDTLPDLRGVFLRGLNTFESSRGPRSDEYADPQSKREPGSMQMDSFQGHHHELENGKDVARRIGRGSTAGEGTWIFSELKVLKPISDTHNGEPRTSPETRPKNVAAYFYVRINR